MPTQRSVIQFIYPELPAAQRAWWLIVDPDDGVDLCSVDPGFDVDLYVAADLRTMTAIWMGLDTVRAAIANRRMMLTGDRQLAADMQTWLGLSPFAKEGSSQADASLNRCRPSENAYPRARTMSKFRTRRPSPSGRQVATNSSVAVRR